MFQLDSIHEVISIPIIISKMHHFAFPNIEKYLPFLKLYSERLTQLN